MDRQGSLVGKGEVGTLGEENELLCLPAPTGDDLSNESESMSMGGSMADLGPIILNSDGSMSRIPNWKDMPKSEQEKTMRVIAKRNKSRKAKLLEHKDVT